jgi:hypothetical protein
MQWNKDEHLCRQRRANMSCHKSLFLRNGTIYTSPEAFLSLRFPLLFFIYLYIIALFLWGIKPLLQPNSVSLRVFKWEPRACYFSIAFMIYYLFWSLKKVMLCYVLQYDFYEN